MCRMIGFSCAQPVRVEGFLRAVAHQAQHGKKPWGRPHGDGWAMVLMTEAGWLQVRCDHPIWESPLEELGALQARCGLIHARLASPNTPIDITKTHPFCARVGEQRLAFCHNGSVEQVDRMPRPSQVGLPPRAIDSEIYFALVQELLPTEDSVEGALGRAAQRILEADCQPTSLNALLLANDRLVCYKGPTDPTNAQYYTLYLHRPDATSVAVSTEPVPAFGPARELEGIVTSREGLVLP